MSNETNCWINYFTVISSAQKPKFFKLKSSSITSQTSYHRADIFAKTLHTARGKKKKRPCQLSYKELQQSNSTIKWKSSDHSIWLYMLLRTPNMFVQNNLKCTPQRQTRFSICRKSNDWRNNPKQTWAYFKRALLITRVKNTCEAGWEVLIIFQWK